MSTLEKQKNHLFLETFIPRNYLKLKSKYIYSGKTDTFTHTCPFLFIIWEVLTVENDELLI